MLDSSVPGSSSCYNHKEIDHVKLVKFDEPSYKEIDKDVWEEQEHHSNEVSEGGYQVGSEDSEELLTLNESDDLSTGSCVVTNHIKHCNFTDAEVLIKDPVNGHINVKDGARTLYHSLSGEIDEKTATVNLYIAKLLVERGADVNRIFSNLNVSTSLELLINKILLVDKSICYSKPVQPNFIGVHNRCVTSVDEAREQLMLLLELFLDFGGNVNIRINKRNKCTIFHKVLMAREANESLIITLVASGAEVIKFPVFGLPPIATFITNSLFDESFHVIEQIWRPPAQKKPVTPREWKYFNSNTASLMAAMHTGSTTTAIFFLNMPNVIFESIRIYSVTNGSRDMIPCLLLPLLKLSLPYVKYFSAVSLYSNQNYLSETIESRQDLQFGEKDEHCKKSLLCKVVSSALSPVVDHIVNNSLTNLLDVFKEKFVEDVINHYTRFKYHYLLNYIFETNSEHFLLSSLFGYYTTTLQMLCIRTIFDSIFFNKSTDDIMKLLPNLELKITDDTAVRNSYMQTERLVNRITADIINEIISILGLPIKMNILFYLEAVRIQIYFNLNEFESVGEICGYNQDPTIFGNNEISEVSDLSADEPLNSNFVAGLELDESGDLHVHDDDNTSASGWDSWDEFSSTGSYSDDESTDFDDVIESIPNLFKVSKEIITTSDKESNEDHNFEPNESDIFSQDYFELSESSSRTTKSSPSYFSSSPSLYSPFHSNDSYEEEF